MGNIKKWLPVVSLMMAAFIFNTSEFIPIGLLTDIGADFSVSEPKMGLIVSAYAWVVAAASLPLMVAASGMNYRRLMILTAAGFCVFQAASALAPGYASLMGARMGVACCHAIFWGVVPSMAVRTAPKGSESAALGLVISGASVAMIVGLPLGRVIGLWVSWRATFWCIAAVAAIVLAALAAWLPSLPSPGRFPVSRLGSLFRSKLLLSLYAFTVTMVVAYFCAYSYIEPFLASVAGFADSAITAALSLMGVAGVAASALFARSYPKGPCMVVGTAAVALCVSLALLGPCASWQPLAIAICSALACAYTVFNLSNQEVILDNIKGEGATVAMAAYSGLFNLGIGSGSFVGGAVLGAFGIASIGYVGAIIAVAALLICFFALMPHISRPH